MCWMCNEKAGLIGSPERRRFLKTAGVFGAALATGSVSLATSANAQQSPIPKNEIDGSDALKRLVDGNKRYVEGSVSPVDFASTREALAAGQNPFAAILGCSDSRVAPELTFDTGRGDLFVVRVAGNVVTTEGLASLEFCVDVLGTQLIMVLGHERCGAVKAAISSVQSGNQFPGHIQDLVDLMRPPVEKAQAEKGDILKNAIMANVLWGVKGLQQASPILSKHFADGTLKVVGGVYDLETGKVTLVT
ncbi:Carbonic anhydrase 2 [Pseudovibrio axinellae]|uniref:carbonic anhydrase n=1 Tax=Pseudovibrio axinellae TaxID=989403 RepID=A0A161V5P4_9HYPH|nr:carbonic anhydrase [Pseudovibrio axinellae]KZL20159.1 Carbonic anhydrase 2 [Pseudovibrio axinellae]SEQ22811.1 carbonic anhydrase [Pseudovibrio axinellae]